MSQGWGEKDSISDFWNRGFAFSMLEDQFPCYASFTKENTVFQVLFSLLLAFPVVQGAALQTMAKLSFSVFNFQVGKVQKINEHITYKFKKYSYSALQNATPAQTKKNFTMLQIH